MIWYRNSPSFILHIPNFRTCRFLGVPDDDVLQLPNLDLYTTSRPCDFILPSCIFIHRIGELANVNSCSGLDFRLALGFLRRLRFVIILLILQRENKNVVRRGPDIVVEQSLEFEIIRRISRGGRRVLDVDISAKLMLSQGNDICEMEWLVIFCRDIRGWLKY